MRHPGRNIFKGLTYQALAAMSLFLQYMRDPNFSYIYLEAPLSIDFILVFADGHRIICEAKDLTQGLRNKDVKTIVDKLIKKKIVNQDDEILIVCNKLNTDIFERIKSLRSWPSQIYEKEFAKKGYPKNQIELLKKLKIWQQTKTILEETVYILFSEIIGFWLPEENIGEVARSILLQKFVEGSAEGNIYKREDIIDEIKSQACRSKERSTIFKEINNNYQEQIEQILAIQRGELRLGSSELSVLSQDPSLMYFLLDKLKEKENISLVNCDQIWQSCKVYLYPHRLLDIFNNNLQTRENREYILSFIEQSLDQLNRFYYDVYFEYDLAKLLKAIIERGRSSDQTALNIIKKQFEKYDNEFFYLKTNEGELHRKSELCSCLQSLYNKSTDDLKKQVYEFIIDTFNLIEDGGEFSFYAPKEIFRVLKDYLNHNNNEFFKQRFLALSKVLASQYEKFYIGKNYDFKGWDYMGTVSGWWGYDYQISDKHFILETLRPALQDLDKKDRWDFIKEYCITKTKKVSKERPDFLNRVAIPFVLDEYKMENSEALQILREFLLSNRGVPNKAELIYQDLKAKEFSDNQKWNLVKISIDKYDFPENPLVEQIVGDLAQNGFKQAKEQLKIWASTPSYYEKTAFLGSYLIANISTLLDSAPSTAISIFKKFITNPYFVQGFDQFRVHEVYELFARIIARKMRDGWQMWNELNRKDNLTVNQQLLLTGSLLSLLDTENEEAIERAFTAINELTSEYKEFISKFSYVDSREKIIQFIEKYAKADCNPITCFEMIKRFLNDPDPITENDPDDPDGVYNYHKQILEGKNPGIITSVRGRIPWAIQQIVRLGIEERIDDVIELTRNLTKDKNFYVRQQSCVALYRLAQTRNSETEEGKRFMSEEHAKKIEDITFEMLADPENKRVALQVRMARVFNRLRYIDFERATIAVNYFIDADLGALREYLPTIIYFAEVSENFSREQMFWFTDIIIHLIKTNSLMKSTIAAQMCSFSRAKNNKGETYLNAVLKYLPKIVQKYDERAFASIYDVIKDNFSSADHQNELLSIYKKCIEIESEYLNTHQEYPNKIWAPYHWNGNILEMIFKVDLREFLDIFKILVHYPRECNIGDIRNAVDLLCEVQKSLQQDVKDIFENLVDRYPIYYDKKKQWEESIA